MTPDPTLTYAIILVGTITILTTRYYLHYRRERQYFRDRETPPPTPPTSLPPPGQPA